MVNHVLSRVAIIDPLPYKLTVHSSFKSLNPLMTYAEECHKAANELKARHVHWAQLTNLDRNTSRRTATVGEASLVADISSAGARHIEATIGGCRPGASRCWLQICILDHPSDKAYCSHWHRNSQIWHTWLSQQILLDAQLREAYSLLILFVCFFRQNGEHSDKVVSGNDAFLSFIGK